MNCAVRREEAKSKRSAAIGTLSWSRFALNTAAPSIRTARIGKPNCRSAGARAKTGAEPIEANQESRTPSADSKSCPQQVSVQLSDRVPD